VTKRPHHKVIIGVSALVVASTVAAVARPASVPPRILAAEKTSIVAPKSQSEAARRIVASFGDRMIADFRIGELPPGIAQRDAVWIYYRVHAATTLQQVRGYWQGLISSATLRTMSASRGWPNIAGHSFTLLLRDGSERFDSQSVLGHPFYGAVAPTSESALRSILRSATKSQGVSLQTIRFPHPLGRRVVVEASVSTRDPSAFARNASKRLWRISIPIVRNGGRPRAEGIFVEVHDLHGHWVAAYGYAVRIAAAVSVTNTKFHRS
jgi:hypothetical protein